MNYRCVAWPLFNILQIHDVSSEGMYTRMILEVTHAYCKRHIMMQVTQREALHGV